MSTVLWANVLVAGQVTSDETDHAALYKHARKLDAIARSLALTPFLDLCDTTDQTFNLDDAALPVGVTSTDELMAVRGAWMPATDALKLLQVLRDHILEKDVRFGLLGNAQSAVVAELDAVISFVKTHASRAEKFNFSVVA